MTNTICPYCKFPVPIKGVQLRHFGTHVAHMEDECFRLLHAEIALLRAENERLRDWIAEEGKRTDTCTINVLGLVCEDCRCGKLKTPNADVVRLDAAGGQSERTER